MVLAIAACCAALVGLASAADAAPYPPTQPCAVTATRSLAVSPGSRSHYEVAGVGLGPAQLVRLSLAATGETLGWARTDSAGGFQTVVLAPAPADGQPPAFTATSAQRRCASHGGGDGGSNGGSNGGSGNDGDGAGAPPGRGAPPASGGTLPAPTSSGESAPATSPATPSTSAGSTTTGAGSTDTSPVTNPSGSATTTSPAPRAEPRSGTGLPFGIGLAVAAVLLVLGTLAVLLLTRRPEH